MPSIVKSVKETQLLWANERGIPIDRSGYTIERDHNLFVPLSCASIAEFDGADGGELGKDGERGKIHALHSSSALAANMFEFWRDRDKSALASSMGLSSAIQQLNFERKFKTGLTGKAPNLDVVLTLADDSIVAIESKFLEPFGRHTSGFREKYFEGGKSRWGEYGYLACQQLAEDLQYGRKKFNWLHPEQLLKHILGLSNSQNQGTHKTPWKLIYLCYDPGIDALGHLEEAKDFAAIAKSDGIDFQVLTYQNLVKTIRMKADPSHGDYMKYLEQRYFT